METSHGYHDVKEKGHKNIDWDETSFPNSRNFERMDCMICFFRFEKSK